jgi:transcriptional regulator with XRE-family HTH domain
MPELHLMYSDFYDLLTNRGCIPDACNQQWTSLDINEQIRLALAALRREHGLTEYALAKAMDLNKSTVYRVENIDDRPGYEPTIDTITRWLDATSQESLTAFFFRVEFGRDSPYAINDLQVYFELRRLNAEYVTCFKELQRRFEDLDLPKTEKYFLTGLQRRLKKVATWQRKTAPRRMTE